MIPNEISALIWGTTELVLLYSVLNESVVVFDGFDTVFVQNYTKNLFLTKFAFIFVVAYFLDNYNAQRFYFCGINKTLNNISVRR